MKDIDNDIKSLIQTKKNKKEQSKISKKTKRLLMMTEMYCIIYVKFKGWYDVDAPPDKEKL